jgi:hypothetical protein
VPDAQGHEAQEIAVSHGVVSRHADTLLFRISGHGPLRFVNREVAADATLDYTYEGTIPATSLHVVQVKYWETFDMLILDGVTGDTVHMVYRPDVSPSGRFAVAAIHDLSGLGEGFNSIQLWQLKPAPARVVWSLDMAQPDTIGAWGASTAGWSGDTLARLIRHIVIPGPKDAQGDYPELRVDARLVRMDTTWRLDTLPR